MKQNFEKDSFGENLIISALSQKEYDNLHPHLEISQLPIGQNFSNNGDAIRYIYFPLNCVVLLSTTMNNGSTPEVGIVGSEGVLGISALMGVETAPFQSHILCSEDTLRIEADILKQEFDKCGELCRLILRYIHSFYIQISQTAACNKLHNIRERLCRWLLMMDDRISGNKLAVTQEFISQMLATRRPHITNAIGLLKKEGAISCSRGNIEISNRHLLEERACECYGIINSEFKYLIENADLSKKKNRHSQIV